MIKSYRKTDQEYYDDYDRYAIRYLKEVEEKEQKEYPMTVKSKGKSYVFEKPLFSKFENEAIKMSRRRESHVRERILEDENKDRLVKYYKEPQNIKCNICETRMALSSHAFSYSGHEILFLFDCPRGNHKSRRIILPNGEEIFIPKSTCKSCGGEILTTSKKKEIYNYCNRYL